MAAAARLVSVAGTTAVRTAVTGGMARSHASATTSLCAMRTIGAIRSVSSTGSRSSQEFVQTYTEEMRQKDRSVEYGPRRAFKPKETYRPRDLNDRNAQSFINSLDQPPTTDILERLDIDPLRDYKDKAMLSHFVTELGHIKPRRVTGLTPVNQYKVARAIKRARVMGLLPFTYRSSVN